MVGQLTRAQLRAMPLAVSLVAHIVVIGLLVWGLAKVREAPVVPVMNVELAPPWPPQAPEPEERPLRDRRAVRDAPVLHETLPTPEAPPPAVVPDAAPMARNVRQALRGLVGCNHADLAGLSDAERERCQERAAVVVEAPRPLALRRSAEFDAAKSPEAYLNRRPTKGCKVRAAGDVDAMGQHGAAAGVTCVRTF